MAQGVETGAFSAVLAPPVRLAIAYAPARARPSWTALLALDQRLSRAATETREPLIGQLKLAWWRDRMRQPASQWPAGEPLLAALKAFDGERTALERLVDAWEALIGDEGGEADLAALAGARAGAVRALGGILGCPSQPDEIATLARRWTIPGSESGQAARLPRELRPLLILADLPDLSGGGAIALMRIVRLGLFGR